MALLSPAQNDTDIGQLMTNIFDKAKLQQIMPAARDEYIDRYLDALNTELPKYGVDTPLRMAHFIAQIAKKAAVSSTSLKTSTTAQKRCVQFLANIFIPTKWLNAMPANPKTLPTWCMPIVWAMATRYRETAGVTVDVA
jgi:hypothetical protein